MMYNAESDNVANKDTQKLGKNGHKCKREHAFLLKGLGFEYRNRGSYLN